jgi:hypothetical protein
MLQADSPIDMRRYRVLSKRSVGGLYIVTALLTGYWEFSIMMQTAIGRPWSWWYPVTFGASILLLLGGISTIFSRVRKEWILILAIIVVMAFCAVIGCWSYWTWVCTGYVAGMMVVVWSSLALAGAVNKSWLVPFMASAVLASRWIPGVITDFDQFLSPKSLSTDVTAILLELAPFILVTACLITVLVVRDPSRTDPQHEV